MSIKSASPFLFLLFSLLIWTKHRSTHSYNLETALAVKAMSLKVQSSTSHSVRKITEMNSLQDKMQKTQCTCTLLSKFTVSHKLPESITLGPSQ